MIFEPTPITGAFVVRPERVVDERGYFARTYCVRELTEQGLDPAISQASLSFNRRRGTLRGMHFQAAPHEENKIVSCQRGSFFDVIVDLRRESPSYKRWFGVTLTEDEATALYIPKGCAHGFITLADDTLVHYFISGFYHPESARGVRFDDPAFAIEWPLPPVVIAARDRAFPDFAG